MVLPPTSPQGTVVGAASIYTHILIAKRSDAPPEPLREKVELGVNSSVALKSALQLLEKGVAVVVVVVEVVVEVVVLVVVVEVVVLVVVVEVVVLVVVVEVVVLVVVVEVVVLVVVEVVVEVVLLVVVVLVVVVVVPPQVTKEGPP